MHAGGRSLGEMMALLCAHPTVYVDIAGLQSPAMTPHAGYAWYLQTLIESGFAGRIIFGFDFSNQVESGIQMIVDATFLSVEQKVDLLCGSGSIPASFRVRLCAMSSDLASVLRLSRACCSWMFQSGR